MKNATPVAARTQRATRRYVVIGRVRRPGELAPGPQHQPEHKNRLPDGSPGDVPMQDGNDLRNRKDKHEVEEQFHERDTLVVWSRDV